MAPSEYIKHHLFCQFEQPLEEEHWTGDKPQNLGLWKLFRIGHDAIQEYDIQDFETWGSWKQMNPQKIGMWQGLTDDHRYSTGSFN